MNLASRRAAAALAIVLALPACWAGAPAASSATQAGAGYASDRAIIRTAWIRVTVGDVRAAAARVEQAAQSAGGFVEQSSTGADAGAELRVRIPSTALDRFLNDVGALGHEEERQVSAQDVTEEVADLEASLANNRSLRDRLRGLLPRAKTVKEVLEVETELNRIQTEIDQQEGRLKRLRSQVELSGVTVQLARRRILGPLGYVLYGAGWVLEKLFVIRD